MTDSISGVYSHSGKLGAAVFLVPAGGLLAAVVLSIVYAYVDVYSPIAGYLSVLFVGAVAFGLGWTISKIGYLSRCRNPGFLRLVGLACGLVALYVSWATFEYALLKRFEEGVSIGLLDVLVSPSAIWDIARSISAEGWYTVGSITPSGIVIWLTWIVEAVFIVGGSTLLATMAIDESVYCESCDQWCRRSADPLRFGVPEDAARLDELRPDNLQPLAALEPVDESVPSYLRVDTWQCPSCNHFSALKAKIAAVVADSDGDENEKSEDLTEIWIVAPKILDKIKRLADKPPAKSAETGQAEA